jgi:hypothetical protein
LEVENSMRASAWRSMPSSAILLIWSPRYWVVCRISLVVRRTALFSAVEVWRGLPIRKVRRLVNLRKLNSTLAKVHFAFIVCAYFSTLLRPHKPYWKPTPLLRKTYERAFLYIGQTVESNERFPAQHILI